MDSEFINYILKKDQKTLSLKYSLKLANIHIQLVYFAGDFIINFHRNFINSFNYDVKEVISQEELIEMKKHFKVKIKEKYQELLKDYTPSRIGTIYEPIFGTIFNISKNEMTSAEILTLNNNIIASMPHSKFLKKVKAEMLKRYKRLAKNPDLLWKLKRSSEYISQHRNDSENRFSLTLSTTGPALITDIISEQHMSCFKTSGLSDEYKRIESDFSIMTRILSGIRIKNDGNWHKDGVRTQKVKRSVESPF